MVPLSHYLAVGAALFVLGAIGLGFAFVPDAIAALQGVKPDQSGVASGLINTSQQIGGALGLAILATFAASRTENVQGVSQSQALVDGFHVAFLGGAVFVLVALVVYASLLRRRDVEAIEAEAATVPIG